jgi:ribosome-binding factor A
MKSHRLARVSEVIRETAANAILFDLKDPRVKGVTVTRAEVSADLQHAKVFVSVMGSEKEQQLTMHGLKSAAGFIQTKLADRLTSRYIPHVTFVLDEGVKKSIEIARIIREENERIAVDHPQDEAAGADAAFDDEEEDDTDVDPPDEPGQPPPADLNTLPPSAAPARAPGANAADGSTERPN